MRWQFEMPHMMHYTPHMMQVSSLTAYDLAMLWTFGPSVRTIESMIERPFMLATPLQIKAGRTLLGWTAKEFADRLDVDRATVARIESGSKLVSLATQERATKILQDGGIVFIARDHIGGEGLRYAEPRAPYPELPVDTE